MTYSEIGFIFLIASFLIQCFYLFYFSARVAFIKENKSFEKKAITRENKILIIKERTIKILPVLGLVLR